MVALTSRSAVVWRYLPGGRVRHALPTWHHDPVGHPARALCGLETFRAQDWWGTGSWQEYEAVGTRRECRRCTAQLGPREADHGAA